MSKSEKATAMRVIAAIEAERAEKRARTEVADARAEEDRKKRRLAEVADHRRRIMASSSSELVVNPASGWRPAAHELPPDPFVLWEIQKRWERYCEFESFVFECDTAHVCWLDAQACTCLVCFSEAFSFYGCRVCARSHYCRVRWDDCLKMLQPDGHYVCVFSGKVLGTEEAVGSFEEECRVIDTLFAPGIDSTDSMLTSVQSTHGAIVKSIKAVRDWENQERRQLKQNGLASAADAAPDEPPRDPKDHAIRDEGDDDNDDDTNTHALSGMSAGDDNTASGMDAGEGGGGGSGGGSGGGERYTALSSSDARSSGLSVNASLRSNLALLKRAHNLPDLLDTSVYSARFLRMNLNDYGTLNERLRTFDAEHAHALEMDRLFGDVTLAEPSEGKSVGGPPTGAADADTATDDSDDDRRALATRSDYRRAMHQTLRAIQSEVAAMVNVLGEMDQLSLDERIERTATYQRFARNLFQVLAQTDPYRAPSQLRHIGGLVMLELLAEPYYVGDRTARNYRFMVWNADPWLARLKNEGKLGALFVHDTRNKSRQKALRTFLKESKNKVATLTSTAKHKAPVFARANLATWLKTFRRLCASVTLSPQAFRAALFN